MLWKVLTIIFLAGRISAEFSFMDRYSVENVLGNCYGEIYLHRTRKIMRAFRTCRGLPVVINMDDDLTEVVETSKLEGPGLPELRSGNAGTESSSPGEGRGGAGIKLDLFQAWKIIMNIFNRTTANLTKSQIVLPIIPFNLQLIVGRKDYLKRAVTKAKAKISNFTCALQELGVIDENYKINLDIYHKVDEGTDGDLQSAIYKETRQCHEFGLCHPNLNPLYPFPKKLQRALAFVRCSNMARLKACMMRELKKHIEDFDISEFGDPESGIPRLDDLGSTEGTNPQEYKGIFCQFTKTNRKKNT
ncbi:uncharacterized protein LOC135217435 [Macrobrachium nipponense]|uniref:uncharacterized protein LOC135217435 n=1 Tax=Macrobrachium nipponense TaxID=159736 RepID=UPI0030C87C28